MAAKKVKKTGKKKAVRSFRPLLKELVQFLNVNDNESCALWHILTALRGPDDDSPKSAITGVIRYTIGLEALSYAAVVNPDNQETALIRREYALRPCSNHFWEHAKKAFAVLGLKWNEVNQ